VRHGGVVVVSAISPYRDAREAARAAVGPGRFVEVFVDTPPDVCEARDPKGLYRRARLGELPGFTGVDDPYERPEAPDVVLDTVTTSAAENVGTVLAHLRERGYGVDAPGAGASPPK
jgi:adenylylsulfate kinase-like enzyme